jgi:hypothetical protein
LAVLPLFLEADSPFGAQTAERGAYPWPQAGRRYSTAIQHRQRVGKHPPFLTDIDKR